MSTLTLFERSSCGVTASESDSKVVTLAAVHDPPGRNSSTSPDGVAVNRGAVTKIYSSPIGAPISLALGAALTLTCLKKRKGQAALLTQINSTAVGLDRTPAGLCSDGR